VRCSIAAVLFAAPMDPLQQAAQRQMAITSARLTGGASLMATAAPVDGPLSTSKSKK